MDILPEFYASIVFHFIFFGKGIEKGGSSPYTLLRIAADHVVDAEMLFNTNALFFHHSLLIVQLLAQYFLDLLNLFYQRYTLLVNPPRITSFEVNPMEKRFGTIRINLDKLVKESGLSKNKLSQRAEMQRTQFNKYCNNTITRLDTDVLAKLCTVFNCQISDLLEFVPPEKEDAT